MTSHPSPNPAAMRPCLSKLIGRRDRSRRSRLTDSCCRLSRTQNKSWTKFIRLWKVIKKRHRLGPICSQMDKFWGIGPCLRMIRMSYAFRQGLRDPKIYLALSVPWISLINHFYTHRVIPLKLLKMGRELDRNSLNWILSQKVPETKKIRKLFKCILRIVTKDI